MNIFELFNKKKKSAVIESRMNQIDQAIQERLVAGQPAEKIAQELNIPLDWVEQYKFTKVDDSSIDMFGNPADRQHGMNEDDVEEAIGQKFIVTLQNVTTKKTSTVLVSAQDEDDAKDMVRHHAGLGQAIINAQPARGNEQTTYVFQGGRLMPTQGVAEAGNKPGWALDPKTRLELKKRQERQKTIAKYAGKDVPKQDVAEMDKSQTPPARHGDYPLGAKGNTVKPTTAKKVVKDMSKDFEKAFAKEKGVAEGWSGNEPTWVCVNGKKWKLFPTHDHARNVGDKLQAKFRKEGRKDQVSYISTDTDDVNENDMSDIVESRLYAMKRAGYEIL